MTSVSNLQTVFGGVSGGDSVKLSGGAAAFKTDTSLTAGLDQTVVSSTAGALAQGLGGSDVRADKVAALQSAIADGSYSVSSADLAEKLIGAMLGRG